MLPPLRDTKIVDVSHHKVFECIMRKKMHGWKLAREKKIGDKMRLVFERIHVDQRVIRIERAVRVFKQVRPYKKICLPSPTNTPRNHYELHGIYQDPRERFVDEILRNAQCEVDVFYAKIKARDRK